MKVKIKIKKLSILFICFLLVSIIINLFAKQFFYLLIPLTLPIGIYIGYLIEKESRARTFWREMLFLYIIVVMCYSLSYYEMSSSLEWLRPIIGLANSLSILVIVLMFGLIIGAYIEYFKKRLS